MLTGMAFKGKGSGRMGVEVIQHEQHCKCASQQALEQHERHLTGKLKAFDPGRE
jgi:hypothetical protein